VTAPSHGRCRRWQPGLPGQPECGGPGQGTVSGLSPSARGAAGSAAAHHGPARRVALTLRPGPGQIWAREPAHPSQIKSVIHRAASVT
jgi:hypothetical protein